MYYTFCRNSDWLDDNFDFDWCEDYYGTYGSFEEARAEAKKLDSTEKWVIIETD